MFPRRPPGPGRASDPARSTARTLAAALTTLVLLVACGAPGPTATPTPTARPSASPGSTARPTAPPDPATVYATIEEQVRAIRGLTAKAPVVPKVLDDAGIKKLTEDSFRKDNPPDVIAANERLLKMLGLLAADASLEDLYIELLGSQVAGLYSPDDKQLYVVSKTGGLGPVEKTTFAHEYTHALQDQNFNLTGMELDQIGEGDRALGRLALIEGDATLVMSLWQQQNLTLTELTQLLSESLDPESTKILEDMPAVLRESLLFPYVSGISFVQGIQAQGGWDAVNDAFGKPPTSTEQVLHPEKYDAGEVPKPVDLPDDLAARVGAGWSVGLEDTLGELQLKLWLANAAGGVASAQGKATTAAAGWGGDRVAILDGPGGATAVVIDTAWDTPADAAEFATQARLLVNALPDPGDVLATVGRDRVTVVIASSEDLVGRLENVLGLAG